MSDDPDNSEDWEAGAAPFEQLAKDVGDALKSPDDDAMLGLLEEVESLLHSGNDSIARALTQAGLLRTIHGTNITDAPDLEQLLGLGRFDGLVDEVIAARTPSMLAGAALGAAGLVFGDRDEYERALEAHRAAAMVWAAAGQPEREATELLRAGASAFYAGPPEDALRRSTLARTAYERLGDRRGAIWATLNMLQVADRDGDADTVQRLLHEAQALNIGLRDGHITCSILIQEGALLAETGHSAAARDRFLKAYRNAHRRQDPDQALLAAKNLGLVHMDLDQPHRSIQWWEKAADHAVTISDWRAEQNAHRNRGIALARVGRDTDAAAALQHAVHINEDHHDPLNAAQARADLGAVILEHALRDDTPTAQFTDLTAQAVVLLNTARSELEGLGDFAWAATTVRNLRTGWILQHTEADGAHTLRDAATQYADADPSYGAELRRVAAWLSLAAGVPASDDAQISDALIDAVVATSDDAVEQAWSLAKEAAALADRGFTDAAANLYDAALARLSADTDPSAFGNILNDSVLVLERLERMDEVRERLLVVERIARASEDRVLLSLALSNLGETAARDHDDTRARDYFTASVALAEDIGDDSRVAIGLASIATTYLNTNQITEADDFSRRALQLAHTAGTTDAWLRATSATASVAYLRADYEAAFTAWDACASRAGAAHADDYPAFALDSLAQIGNWPRFRRELDRHTKRAQRAHAQDTFVRKLHLSVFTWLQHGRPAAAGTVLGYSVMLGFEGASSAYGTHGRELSTAERRQSVTQITTPLGAATAVFVLLDLTPRDKAAVRRAYERTITRAAGPDARELIDTADRYILTHPDAPTEP